MANSNLSVAPLESDPTPGRPRKLSQERILEAAMEAIADQGFGALSIRSLARRLGVTHSTLYNYVDRIEDVEEQALNLLVKKVSLPVSVEPDRLKGELLSHLVGLRLLLIQHAGLLFPPIESKAWKTFMSVTNQWLSALTLHASDSTEAALAYRTLVSYVSTSAAMEREYGPEYIEREQKALGRLESDSNMMLNFLSSEFSPKESPDSFYRASLSRLVDHLLPNLSAKASEK